MDIITQAYRSWQLVGVVAVISHSHTVLESYKQKILTKTTFCWKLFCSENHDLSLDFFCYFVTLFSEQSGDLPTLLLGE